MNYRQNARPPGPDPDAYEREKRTRRRLMWGLLALLALVALAGMDDKGSGVRMDPRLYDSITAVPY